MEQRTRQQKILKTIEPLIFYCYDQGVWHSLIVHTLLLTVLALLSDNKPIHKPIAIDISFSSIEEEVAISDGVVSMPSIEDTTRAIDASSIQKETVTDIAEVSPPMVSEIANPIQDELSHVHAFTSNIPTSDLLAYTNSNHETQDTSNTAPESNDTGNNIDTFNISDIIDSIEKGVAHNNISANRADGSGIENRLSSYGAKTGDVQISLAWNTIDDIDLHVKFTPGNGLVDNIDWTNRIGKISNGMLDIDMNANSAAISPTPVENIFWPPGSSLHGSFAVYVHFFRSWTGNTKVPVTVRIKNGARVDTLQVIAHLYSNPQIVKQFSYPINKKNSF